MAYEFMYMAAMDLIQKKKETGEIITAEDTVCIIYSRSGKIYSGSSKAGNYMNPLGVHAEIEAVRYMQAFNETAIEAIMLVHIYSNGLILPCNNCLSYISSINPANNMSVIVVSDRLIPINEVVQYAAPSPGANVPPFPAQPADKADGPAEPDTQGNDTPSDQSQTETSSAEKASGSYLKNKVNDLMNVAIDDEEEEIKNAPRTKGKTLFGAIFGRR